MFNDWEKGGHGHSGGNHSHVAFFKLGDGGGGGGCQQIVKIINYIKNFKQVLKWQNVSPTRFEILKLYSKILFALLYKIYFDCPSKAWRQIRNLPGMPSLLEQIQWLIDWLSLIELRLWHLYNQEIKI